MKHLLFFLMVGMIMSSCSNSGNKTQSAEQGGSNEVVISNDLENAMGVVPSWLNENTVIAMKEPPAHTGNYACVTNDTIEYSYFYREIVKNLRSGSVPKMVIYSGWVYTTVANPNFEIVCGIKNDTTYYNWKAFPLDKELSEPGKWLEFSASFSFEDKPLIPEHEIGLVAWNHSKKAVYIDDLKITFIY